jgi:adenosylcobinamide hydrolase
VRRSGSQETCLPEPLGGRVDVRMQTRIRKEEGRDLPLLVWRFPASVRMIASAPHGGGIGMRRWVINAQVPPSYARRDPEHHLGKLGISLGLPGRGVGMLTAADVRAHAVGSDHGVEATATVGLGHPIRAAAPHTSAPVPLVGTINILVLVPERLSDAAMVNAVATVTEAKAQALTDLGLDATGTATDALCIACPAAGSPASFGGPRSIWGSRIARAVHTAVLAGGR